MEIGILIANERKYDEAFDWDYDYIEGFPGMLGPDEDDRAPAVPPAEPGPSVLRPP